MSCTHNASVDGSFDVNAIQDTDKEGISREWMFHSMRRSTTKVVGWIEAGGVGANRKMKFHFDAFDSGAVRSHRKQETGRH